MVEVLDFFMKVVTVQLVYGLLLTIVAYAVQGQISATDIADFQAQKNVVDVNNISTTVENQFNQQTGFAIVDVGALALYTGNFVFDMIINSITAIPSMVTLIINVLFGFMNVGGVVKTAVIFVFATLAFLTYAIVMLSMLLGIRSQGTVR